MSSACQLLALLTTRLITDRPIHFFICFFFPFLYDPLAKKHQTPNTKTQKQETTRPICSSTSSRFPLSTIASVLIFSFSGRGPLLLSSLLSPSEVQRSQVTRVARSQLIFLARSLIAIELFPSTYFGMRIVTLTSFSSLCYE